MYSQTIADLENERDGVIEKLGSAPEDSTTEALENKIAAVEYDPVYHKRLAERLTLLKAKNLPVEIERAETAKKNAEGFTAQMVGLDKEIDALKSKSKSDTMEFLLQLDNIEKRLKEYTKKARTDRNIGRETTNSCK